MVVIFIPPKVRAIRFPRIPFVTSGRSWYRHDRANLHEACGAQRGQDLDHKSRNRKALDMSGLERSQGGNSMPV